MLYFAYGSNMDWKQMRTRCPSAKFVCVAKLENHQLEFTRKSTTRSCGVSDVVPSDDSCVWGVVYEIPESEIGLLDKSEGYRPGRKTNSYVRAERHVLEKGNEERPFLTAIYFAVKQKNPPPPSAKYKSLIVGGAKYWHLPDEYIKELELIKTSRRRQVGKRRLPAKKSTTVTRSSNETH